MGNTYVRIEGAAAVGAYFKSLREGVATAGGETIVVGSSIPYAFGMETGRFFRGGRMARRAGGAFFLRDALNAVKPDIPDALVAALPKGDRATLSALVRLGSAVRREERARAPLGTGKLRRSIRMVIGRR